MKTILFLLVAAVFWLLFSGYCITMTYAHFTISAWASMILHGLCALFSMITLYIIVFMGILFEVRQLGRNNT